MGMDSGKLLNLLAQLDPDRLEYLITEGHRVEPTDGNNPKSLDEQQVRDWINLLYDEGIEGLEACIAN